MGTETNPYGKIEPYVNGYVHRVLPLVYDDALSHIETLARFTAKLNEVINMCNNMSDDIIAEVNAYTDKKVEETFAEIARAVNEIYELKSVLDNNYKEFSRLTDAQLVLFKNRLDSMDIRIGEAIIAINKRTDLAIEQNNEHIFSELGKSLSKIKVTNFFTGGNVSVQEMFDYLALLHTDGCLTYSVLVDKGISYDTLASANVSYTDLVIHGTELL